VRRGRRKRSEATQARNRVGETLSRIDGAGVVGEDAALPVTADLGREDHG
jgi:hypothetical protein